VLALPALQDQERLIIGTCRIKDAASAEAANPVVPDPAVVAVGWFEDIYEPPVTLSYAWRANPQPETFEVLLLESVTCTGIEGL
jgi:hypothetical protein